MKDFQSIDEVLDFAISNEVRAQKFYLDLAEKMDRPVMKKVFIDFAEEEKRHEEMIKKIKENQQVALSEVPVGDLKVGDYLVNAKTGSEMSYQDALILAMKREKAAFLLYQDLAGMLTDPAMQKLFNNLANEEAKHKMYFEVEYDKHFLSEN